VLEYSTDDGRTWTTWSLASSGTPIQSGVNHTLKFRGTGNTKITGESQSAGAWKITPAGTNIVSLSGNIETLLDYMTVAAGLHPPMAAWCFAGMFYANSWLDSCASMPATILTPSCYRAMYWDCEKVCKICNLPATTWPEQCYRSLWDDCDALEVYTDATSLYKMVIPMNGPLVQKITDSSGIEAHALIFDTINRVNATAGTKVASTPAINAGGQITVYTRYPPV
jgi:hypothetical protein